MSGYLFEVVRRPGKRAGGRFSGALARALQLGVAVLVSGLPRVEAATLARGPYLQLLTNSSVTIVWNTDGSAACALEIGPLGDPAPAVVTGNTGTVCAVPVGGLLPGTQYAYVPLADGAPLTGASVFRTDDPRSPYTFLVVGDTGTGSTAQFTVATRMLESAADLIVHTGDMIYPDGEPQDFDPRFFVPYGDLLPTTALWPCLGNHDVHTADGAPWRDAFHTPANNASATENYYSFDYGNAHFVVLDSEHSLTPGSSQYVFLDTDLAASTATWRFVFFHRTLYSSGSHGGNTTLRAALAPLFDRYGVDIVFMGHDHHYERTVPLRDGAVVGPDQGTVYVTTGGGGATIRSVGQSWFTAYAEAAHHFVRVSVAGGMLELEMVRSDGAVGDLATLIKGPPPVCGDGIRNQPSEQCDGTDDGACPGRCDGDCLCPPVCGDGFRHPRTEECDGSEDQACSGACLPHCRCAEVLNAVPIADTYIEAGTEATWDHGASDHLDVDASPRGITYLKFDLRGTTAPVRSARLTLVCTNRTPDGGTVYPVSDSSWVEGRGNGIDGSSAAGPGLEWTQVDANGDGVIDAADASLYVPSFTQPIAALGPVSVGTLVTVDVTAALQAGPQVYTLAIRNGSTDGATYSSKDHPDPNQRPSLRVELAPEPCIVDADCDDGNECTIDACTDDLFCNHAVRADATGCNGGAGLCCDGACTAPPCGADADCNDGQDCTTDACRSLGTCVARCESLLRADGTDCSTGACCSGACCPDVCCDGVCAVPACTAADDCVDGEPCSTDACQDPGTCAAACVHTWPACGGNDSCCARHCTGVTDPDCATVCGNGICEGGGEDCTACPEDCQCAGNRCKKACCGDGVCSRYEGSQNCPVDCGR